MSSTGLDVFDKTLQTTHVWLDELMQEIGPDRQVAWHVLGAVLRAIRDRVSVGLAVHLGSQLPLLVRGIYYDQWHAPGQSLENPSRSLDEFLEPIGKQLSNIRPVNVRDATRAVFRILSRHVNRGQIENVRNAMPGQVRAIWHDSPEAPDVQPSPERYSGDGARANDRGNQPQARARTQKTKRKPARSRTLSKKTGKRAVTARTKPGEESGRIGKARKAVRARGSSKRSNRGVSRRTT